MTQAIDIDEISGCTCRRARRTTRQLTQLYDRALGPARLTANQFDLLANLYDVHDKGKPGISIGALAGRLAMHPTTLNRDLVPLMNEGLVANGDHPEDRRVRAVRITAKGRARLGRAVPHWRKAQRQIEAALGAQETKRLNALLDNALAKTRVSP